MTELQRKLLILVAKAILTMMSYGTAGTSPKVSVEIARVLKEMGEL